MEIYVPDLISTAALEFCKKVNQIEEKDTESYCFDFMNVHTCDPFPMLIVSNEIRRKSVELKRFGCYARNCSNSYAKHMKFYRACGLKIGDEVETERGNDNYSCITKLSVKELREEGQKTFDVLQEVIEKKAKTMAKIVGQGNEGFIKWLAFVIRELIRNIPEHSKSDIIWYCAQYWPSYDLVELAIMDEGIGIQKSLCKNVNHSHMINSDEDAIKLSLEPGISETIIGNGSLHLRNEWDNSGYGLYMVSEMCAELDASFILASGKSAIKVQKEKGKIIQKKYDTNIHGTAIQIRIRPASTVDYDEIRRQIVSRGEAKAKQNKKAIHVASKSSRGL
ncbi:MAG: hypothetical protein HDT40_01690 [Lachnospiraceae bacterium]|nr:hypothetical protein [Lachnospiraceae bacterium]